MHTAIRHLLSAFATACLASNVVAPRVATADEKVETSQASSGDEKSNEARITNEVGKNCERHFPGQIQAEVRAACTASAPDFSRLGRGLIDTRCRLNYGEEPRLVMACLIGSSIAEDLTNSREAFKRKLQLCAETYPVHNEIDAFLQESCLTGTLVPDLMKTEGKARFEACAKITPERSFIGPCAVGLRLTLENQESSAPPAQQNKLCEQYFNLRQFHKGYRACLNARALAAEPVGKIGDAIKDCGNILSEANNDTEKAACLVGLTIHRKLSKREDVSKRFQKCGENKVTYQDRDFLACLTAASLLDFADKDGAQKGCREVFKDSKSRSRGDCINSLTLF